MVAIKRVNSTAYQQLHQGLIRCGLDEVAIMTGHNDDWVVWIIWVGQFQCRYCIVS
jgi:hypothetical protein